MGDEPSDAEVEAYARAPRTPVLFAEGPLVPKGGEMKATQLNLCSITTRGLARVILEDQRGLPALELTAARVASARMESKPFDSTAVVEVRARSDDGTMLGDDGQPQFVVIVGPKRVLKRAFSSIGVLL